MTEKQLETYQDKYGHLQYLDRETLYSKLIEKGKDELLDIITIDGIIDNDPFTNELKTWSKHAPPNTREKQRKASEISDASCTYRLSPKNGQKL